ncbi:hypothetical protein F0562_004782 [Nyssa sinensis]|uniref:Uncharacterized protein n=1 Tax=Nyssa sinensis TaxID=561372 RepID=A0A5J5AGD3_9ASTE|nr:hypothetical protein F0562_004782 [Nyssa sinensis]
MGCGISKFNLEEDGGTHSFYPFRHRIEGMSKSRRAVSEGNPSIKLLLKDGGEELVVVDSNGGRRSVSSPMKDIVVVKARAVQQKSVMAVDSDVTTKKLGGEDKKRREAESKKDGAVAGEKDQDDEEGEYCMDCDSEDSVNYDGNNVGEKREKETIKKEGRASLNSNEGPTTRSVKKERRGRRFRKVFPMGRPAAVRNLLNITACYNPNVSATQARPGKPTEKAV